jgi:hypothetical protein
MHTFHIDPELLNYLRTFKVPILTREKFYHKCDTLTNDARAAGCIGSARDHLREKPIWCEAMAAVVRNAPDERGMTTTILPNQDALAALLAVRVGIDMHLAVALAYDDVIAAWAVADGRLQEANVSPEDAVVLATFSRAGESRSSLALTARKEAWAFKLRYAPEELMLFDQHPEVGLHLPFRSAYFEGHSFANQFACREGKAVYCEGERDPASLFDTDVITAVRDELSTLTYSQSEGADTVERQVQRHLQAVIDKHLGEGVCTAAVSVNSGPVQIDLGDDLWRLSGNMA